MTQKTDKRANKPTMRDWSVMEDREYATIDFVDALQRNSKERDCCIKNPAYAKERFAHHGRFHLAGKKVPKGVPKPKGETPIPKSTEFRVFKKFPIKDRDKLVTIVLPGPGDDEDIAQDWRCTYTPWAIGIRRKKK